MRKGHKLVLTILALVLVALIATVVGVWVDASAFWVNMLAGIVGSILSIGIAVYIVELLLEHRRAKDWAIVRAAVVHNITTQLVSVILDYASVLDAQSKVHTLFENSGSLTPQDLANVKSLQAVLSEKSGVLSETNYKGLHNRVEPHLARLRDFAAVYVVIPGQDPKIITRLQALEGTASQWSRKAQLSSINRDGLAVQAASTFDSVCKLAEGLAK